MPKSIFSRTFLVAILGVFVLAACQKDDRKGDTTLLSSNETVLRYVPADTPYVFAAVEPLPEELMDKLEPKFDRLMAAYRTVLREAVASNMPEAGDEEQRAKAEAFVDEFAGLLSVEGLREAGIGRGAGGAIYGAGLLPVMRLDRIDGPLLDAAISRLEQKAGYKLPVASVEGGGYRYFEGDKGRLILAVFADQAVVSFVPQGFGEEQVAQLLGLTLPETSIADAGVLDAIAAEYGFTAHSIGFADIEAIAAAFVDSPAGLNADLLALAGHNAANITDVCKHEIRSMAGAMPRFVAGYSHIDTRRMDSKFVFELRDDLAAGLAALQSAFPGLGVDRGGLMSFGIGLDVGAAREFIEARVQALEADPLECRHFAGLQQAVAGAKQGLEQPLPPFAYDFKGFVAVINDIEGLDVKKQTPPTSIDGNFMLAIDNAQNLVNMGAMFVPELATLDLQPDGVPVALDLMQLQAMGITAHAALTESAIGIAIGKASESDLEKMLSADVPEQAPFLSFSMDAGRYYSFIGEAISSAPQDADGAQSPEMRAALQEMMHAVGDLYDRMSVDVLFTSNGIEVRAEEMLKD